MLFLTPIAYPGLQAQESTEAEELPELEMFIAEESAAALNDSVLPTDRAISGLFNDATSVLEVPRSVTLISPELMEQFSIDDLDDLEKIGAGTQTVNYYGLAGAPTIRGVKGGTFINGMLRAYNRNEMPLSFGSLEAIEVVKGPAPADFSATKVGGFVNLIPKSPFFDEEKGSIKLELDNWGRKTLSADFGAPFLLPGDTPAAYRVSITTQDGESYYDDIYNDYTSVYGAIKFRPKDGVSVFLGGEYFDYKSNENVGWNRPTQELIDDGEYVIGEPLNATSSDWYGTVDRGQIGSTTALALTAEVAEARIDPALIGFMTYDAGEDKYVYTQAYFDNGGEVLTEKIDGNEVLSDPGDYANSNDLILFGDIVFDSDPDRTITVKGLFEHMETEKNSSYGYAFESEQDVIELKTTVTDRTLIPYTTLTYGASIRYSEALQLTDFWDEPFSRRDITQDTISSNTIVLAGDDSPIGGVNQWGRFGIGSNGESEMTQLAAFLSGQTKLFEDRLILLGSTRYEYADYDVGVPSVVDFTKWPWNDEAGWDADLAEHEANSGDTDFLNWSIGLNFELIDNVFLYGNYQEGTSVNASQAGVISGAGNFAENNLWEVGIKANFFEGSLFTSLAYYEWEQSSFDSREQKSNEIEGEGIEAEITWLVTDHLTLIGSYTWQEVRRVSGLDYRSQPHSEEDWALLGGALDANTGNSIPAANTDLVYPGSPQQVIKLFGIYDFHNGFQVNGGVTWQEEFYSSFDHNIELPAALISSLGAKYTTEKWEVAFNIDNLTNEDYFYGSDPTFAANTLVTKAPERTYTVSFKYMF
ncbi:TonB-dependent siderophore receptor [Thalassobacterium sedimentorum]|nr:TonB-dependent receptor plug domain-containing protein [Coraliomargarita sp. SDUM461004]